MLRLESNTRPLTKGSNKEGRVRWQSHHDQLSWQSRQQEYTLTVGIRRFACSYVSKTIGTIVRQYIKIRIQITSPPIHKDAPDAAQKLQSSCSFLHSSRIQSYVLSLTTVVMYLYVSSSTFLVATANSPSTI